MGIQSTRTITREMAIDRIEEMNYLIHTKRYKDIEERTFEPDYDIFDHLNNDYKTEYRGDIDQWTATMLEDQMDKPYYRFSVFDNYCIGEAEYEY